MEIEHGPDNMQPDGLMALALLFRECRSCLVILAFLQGIADSAL